MFFLWFRVNQICHLSDLLCSGSKTALSRWQMTRFFFTRKVKSYKSASNSVWSENIKPRKRDIFTIFYKFSFGEMSREIAGKVRRKPCGGKRQPKPDAAAYMIDGVYSDKSMRCCSR